MEGWDEARYSDAQLARLPCVEIAEKDAFLGFFSTAVYEAREPMWKGSCLVVVENMNGNKERIMLSGYGGFLKSRGKRDTLI